MSKPEIDQTRKAALDLLNAVTQEQRLLSEVMPKRLAKLSPADRARAGRLCVETLRWADRADRALGPYVRMKPHGHILNAMRLGVYEICQEGAAPYGVVDAIVGVVGHDPRNKKLAGLVNAVLRKIGKRPEVWQDLPISRMPKWLRKQMLADFGKLTVAAMEAAHASPPAIDISVKSDPEHWAKRLGGQVLPTGSVRLPQGVELTKLAGFEMGDWWVQDAAAALPAKILNARPGERVLDLCAAPGGKTMQLAQAGADVTALDVSEKRLKRVEENLSRTKLAATIVAGDALDFVAEPFDAILLDAPCSATGTIRRHPDLQYAKDGGDFPQLFELQLKLISKAWDLLRPGGRIVYCTCSLLIDEGEEQVRDALLNHPDIVVDAKATQIQGVDPAWISETGLRTRPDYWECLGGMDGFFITMLRKPA